MVEVCVTQEIECEGFEYWKSESGCWEGPLSAVLAADFREVCAGNSAHNCKSVVFYLFPVPVSHPEDTLA